MDSAIKYSKAFEPGRARAFTLVEVLISMGLASLLLAAVLSSHVFALKSQAISAGYVSMNSEARKALEILANDLRQMSGVNILASGFSGSVPDAAGTGSITVSYTYSSSLGTLSRSDASGSSVLLDQLQTCQFRFYGAGVLDASKAPARMDRGSPLSLGTSTKVKQVQVEFTKQTTTLRTTTTQQVVSAQFSLRS